MLKCLRKYFEVVETIELDVPEIVKTKCSQTFKTDKQRYVCERSSMAGLSLATLLNELGNNETPVDFSTPDPAVVDTTYDKHPAAQCRLDTYFQGSLCDKPTDEDVSDYNKLDGTCNRIDDYTLGVRPFCWYKPMEQQ
jgi:hypothetical protein